MIDKNDKLKVPKRLYIIDYQLKPCEIDGISDARLNAFPFNTTDGKLVEYLCLDTLWHPASEIPRNDYTEILSICKEPHRPIVLNLEHILDNAPDDATSYNDIWKHICIDYEIIKYIYIGDLLKGGKA